ncbi:STAS domain-containing protein [Verrucomicrobiota bacterium sgz303538]
MNCPVEDIPVETGEILKFSGEIDYRSTPEFRSILQERARAECLLLLLDMSEVDYMDSGGMGALVEYWLDSQQFGGEFILVGLNERLTEIFHMAHLDDHLQIFSTWREAYSFLGMADG